MGQFFSDTSKSEDNEGDLVSSFNAYFKKINTETKIISPETIRLIELHLSKGNILATNDLINDALKKY